MPEYKYSTQKDGENIAKAVARDASISTKVSVNICKMLRGKKVSVAKKMLEEVIAMKRAVPYLVYNKSIPHRRGSMTTGRYPVNAAGEFLDLVKSVEANAQFKGLNTNILVITHIKASTGQRSYHYGRKRRRKTKRTNIEILVEEIKDSEKKREPKAAEAKETKKVKEEAKHEHKAEHKAEPKAEHKHETKHEHKPHAEK